MEDTNSAQGDNENQKEKTSQLEKLSKEELEIKVKKYLMLLQKAKTSHDELSKKYALLEQEKNAANEVILKWQSQNQTETIEELQYCVNQLKKEKQQLLENKNDIDKEKEILITARDTALDAMKKMKSDLSISEAKIKDLVCEIEKYKNIENHLKEELAAKDIVASCNLKKTEDITEKYDDICQKYIHLEKSYESLKTDYETILFEKKELIEIKSQLEKDIEDTEKPILQRITELQDENIRLITEMKNEKKNIKKQLEQLKIKNSELTERNQNLNKQVFVMNQNCVAVDTAKSILSSLQCFDDKEPILDISEMSKIVCEHYNKFKQEFDSLISEKGNKESDSARIISELETKLNELKSNQNISSNQNETLREENEKLTLKVNNLLEQCKNMESTVAVADESQQILLQLPCFKDTSSEVNLLDMAKKISDYFSEIKIRSDALETEKIDREVCINEELKKLTFEVSELTSKLKDMSTENMNLMLKLDNYKSLDEELRLKNTELTQKYEKLYQENIALSEIQNKMKQKDYIIEQIFIKLTTIINQPNANNLIDVAEDVCQRITNLENEINEIQEKNNISAKEINELNLAIEEHKTIISDLTLRTETLYQEKESLSEKLNESEMLLREKEKEIDKMQQEENPLTIEEINDLNSQIEEQKKTISHLTSKSEILIEENRTLSEKLAQFENLIPEKEKEINKLNLFIDKHENTITDLMSKTEMLSQKNISLLEQLDESEKLQEENRLLVNQINELNLELEEQKTTILNLTSKMELLGQEKHNLSEKLTQSENLLQKQGNEINKVQEENLLKLKDINELNILINEHKATISDLTSRTETLCQENYSLSEKLSESKNTLQDKLDAFDKKHEALLQYSEKVQELQGQCDIKSEIILQLEDNLKKATEKPMSVTVEIQTVASECNDAFTDMKNVFNNASMQTDCLENVDNTVDFGISEWGYASGQISTSLSDAFTQMELTFSEKQNQTDITMEKLYELIQENEELKLTLNTKSHLVDEIQSLLDLRLSKEEELSEEIRIKNSELQLINNEKKLLQSDLQLAKATVKDTLLKMTESISEFRLMEHNIKDEMKRLQSDFISILYHTSQNITSNCANLKVIQGDLNHFKNYVDFTTSRIKDIVLLNVSKNTDDQFMLLVNNLRSTDLNDFDTLLKHSELLYNAVEDNLKQLLGNISCQEKELLDYKETIIPQLENKISELEKGSGNTKMDKLKAVALKLKKDATEYQSKYKECLSENEKCKQQISDIALELNNMSTTHAQYVLNFKNLQSENDKLQDEREELKLSIKNLQTKLTSLQADFNKYKENLALTESELKKSKQLISTFENQTTGKEAKLSDLESKIIVLEAKVLEDQNKIKSLASDLAKSQKDLSDSLKEKDALKKQLEDALKEGKQHSLIDLEMADYERSIQELTAKLEKKSNETEELLSDNENLKSRIETLQAEIKFCENHRDTEEKRADGFKEALENAKKELATLKEQDAELKSNLAQSNLKLEALGQKEEDYKALLSTKMAEIERLKDMIQTSATDHDRIVRSLKSKISTLEQNMLMAHKEVESVKQDFDGYKIRVHSVLKQQKTVTPTNISEFGEKEKFEAQIEKLNLHVKELSDKVLAVTLEKDTLQDEYDHLSQRFNKIVEELDIKDQNWKSRLEKVNAEKTRLQSHLQNLTTEHALQIERQTSMHKKQIKSLQEQHEKVLKDLQSQLEAADIEIANLQKKSMNIVAPSATQEEPFSFDIFSQERQEGEGSECIDNGNIKPLSIVTVPTSGFIPFEKLLQSPVESEASYTSYLDPEKLNNELNASIKKIDHLRELLNDSEANNMRLGEQVRVLKEEIRRLERNKQRTEQMENLEYLKNVFIKFATLSPGSERSMLIPVLTTMLKLSPEEQLKLKLVAGDKSLEEGENSWGSYLQLWSGI